jgi:hypothetical protein
MISEENSQQSNITTQDKIWTPEPFSPDWNADPVDLLDAPLNFPYSSDEWDRIFATLLELLSHQDYWVWERAICQLIKAVEMEASQHSICDDYQPKPTEQRVESMFAAIATQAHQNPHIFDTFCARFHFIAEKPPYKGLVLEWLHQLANAEDEQILDPDAIVAAQIYLGIYDDAIWEEVGTMLISLLDHANLNIRACAAYQIGKFYSKVVLSHFSGDELEWAMNDETIRRNQQLVAGMPPLEAMLQQIRNKEIERPGLAGAFWGEISKKSFDAKEWLLDVLEHSPEPEPYIPYFPCNLAFDAHERFSEDADAIRRLLNMGHIDLALMAATDQSRKIAELEPLLIEMGNHTEPEVVRIASWSLAYYYHYLHPHGAKLGYVECVSELPEIDLFLLFTKKEEAQSPYGIVIYTKGDVQMSRAMAQHWVDRIFPNAVRGDRTDDSPSTPSCWYQNGYIKYQSSDLVDSGFVDHVIIGYRSSRPWNPKQFL